MKDGVKACLLITLSLCWITHLLRDRPAQFCSIVSLLCFCQFCSSMWDSGTRRASERQNKHGLWVEVGHEILLAKLLSMTQWAWDWYLLWPRQCLQDVAMGIQVQLSPKGSILLRRRQDPKLSQNSRPVSIDPEALGSASIVQSLILRTPTRWFLLVFSKLWWRTGEGRE